MSYQYVISTGQLFEDGNLIGTGWAGHDTATVQGQNNPTEITVVGIGPLPPGSYTIGDPINSPHLGPMAFPLTPDPANIMYGRSGFYIHGAQINPTVPDTSSDGCIIQQHNVRLSIEAAIQGAAIDDPVRGLEVTPV